jgi:hypothetical protein
LILAVIACSPSSIAGLRTIGGFEVGERRCDVERPVTGPDGRDYCAGYRAVGEAALEDAVPSHPPIAAMEVYDDPVHVRLSGYGERAIVVIRLVDDSVHAFRVQCGAGADPDICSDTETGIAAP